ncbi:MAG: hypothetical protein AB7F59_07815 [Bdellovibrionales bacterium]
MKILTIFILFISIQTVASSKIKGSELSVKLKVSSGHGDYTETVLEKDLKIKIPMANGHEKSETIVNVRGRNILVYVRVSRLGAYSKPAIDIQFGFQEQSGEPFQGMVEIAPIYTDEKVKDIYLIGPRINLNGNSYSSNFALLSGKIN